MASANALVRYIYELIEESEQLIFNRDDLDSLRLVRIELYKTKEELIDTYSIEDDGDDYILEFYEESLAISVYECISDAELVINEISNILRFKMRQAK